MKDKVISEVFNNFDSDKFKNKFKSKVFKKVDLLKDNSKSNVKDDIKTFVKEKNTKAFVQTKITQDRAKGTKK